MEWIREHIIFLKKIGIIAGVYVGMKYLVPLVIPFLIALVLVYWCQPLLLGVQRRIHVRPAFTMSFFLLLILGAAAAGIYLAGQQAGGGLRDFLREGTYQQQTEQFLYDCCDRVSEVLQMESEDLRIFVTKQLNLFQDQASQTILPGAMDSSWQALKGVGGFLAGVLVTAIATVLLAADFEKLKAYTEKQWFYKKAVDVIRGILQSLGGYLKAQGMIMLVVMAICVVGIGISGWVQSNSQGNMLPDKDSGTFFEMIIRSVGAGIATGALDALPVFGTGTVFLPWIVIKIFQKKYIAAVILAVTYGLCVLARELLEPKLVGDKLGLFPVVVLASIYAGVQVYGFGGIFLGPVSVLLIRELWKQV